MISISQCEMMSKALCTPASGLQKYYHPCRKRGIAHPELAGLRALVTDRRKECLKAANLRRKALIAQNEVFSIAEADMSNIVYSLTQQADSIIQDQLNGISPVTYVVILAAGLLTSLSPCTLSVLPLTIGYIGGYSDAGKGKSSPLLSRASAFAFGLATTLALLGIGSSFLGKTYGQVGGGLPIIVSFVAILMGFNLLDVITLRLPSVDLDTRKISAPPTVQAYLAGCTFALVASPCSTPILATLLAFVSQTKDPILGGSLLLAYTTGYVGPLLVAATFAGALKQVMAVRQYSGWITPTSGALLLAGGTYGLLSRALPSA